MGQHLGLEVTFNFAFGLSVNAWCGSIGMVRDLGQKFTQAWPKRRKKYLWNGVWCWLMDFIGFLPYFFFLIIDLSDHLSAKANVLFVKCRWRHFRLILHTHKNVNSNIQHITYITYINTYMHACMHKYIHAYAKLH